ncbi:hypothetical protein KBE88_03090 [Candidatus Saccharibacteria bacterium]|nr:hypothetical protein [Candidatus Saccharibacteria bacterium]
MIEDRILRRDLSVRTLKWFMISIPVFIMTILAVLDKSDESEVSWPLAIAVIIFSLIIAIRGFRHLTTLKVMKITNDGLYNLTVSKSKRRILVQWKSINFWSLVEIDKKNFLVLTIEPSVAAQFSDDAYANDTNEKNTIIINITNMQKDHIRFLNQAIEYYKIPEKTSINNR